MRAIRTQASVLLACIAIFSTACGDDDGAGTDGGTVGMDGGGRDGSAPMCETTGDENTAEACGDSCDNDGDTFADCDDRDCCTFRTDCPATTFCGRPRDGGMVMMCETAGDENTVAACSNGCDDDGNGFFDCGDFDCCGVRTDCPATTACGMRDGGVPAMNYTIEQLQDRDDPMHPTPGVRVNVDQDGMVALTPRLLVGSSRPMSGSCRFAIWVGAPVSGEFTAIAVEELIPLPAGMTCFDAAPNRISADFAPGDAVTAITNASYREFCAGPTPAPSPCTDYEQSSIFLGGSATITRGAAGTAPVGTVVELNELVSGPGAPGGRAVALEGGLLTIENVRLASRTEMPNPTTTITLYSAYLDGSPGMSIEVLVSNFRRTSCVREHFDTLAEGTGTATLTGVLLPSFGRWTLRLRDENDVEGLTCADPTP